MKKNKKTLFYVAAFFSVMIITLIAFDFGHIEAKKDEKIEQHKSNDEIETINVSATYKMFPSVDEMETEADLVLIVRPVKDFFDREHSTTFFEDPYYEGNKFIDYFYTLTDVKVKKVLYSKEPLNDKLKNITIVEQVSVFTDNDGSSKKITTDDYEEMKKNEDYLVYLKRNPAGNYIIINLSSGIFKISEMKKQSKNEKQFHQKIKSETIKKYGSKITQAD